MISILENLILFFIVNPLGVVLLMSFFIYCNYLIVRSIIKDISVKDVMKDAPHTYAMRNLKKYLHITETMHFDEPSVQPIQITIEKPRYLKRILHIKPKQ